MSYIVFLSEGRETLSQVAEMGEADRSFRIDNLHEDNHYRWAWHVYA